MELAAETGEEEEEEDSLRGRVTRGRSGPAKKKIDFFYKKRHVGCDCIFCNSYLDFTGEKGFHLKKYKYMCKCTI